METYLVGVSCKWCLEQEVFQYKKEGWLIIHCKGCGRELYRLQDEQIGS